MGFSRHKHQSGLPCPSLESGVMLSQRHPYDKIFHRLPSLGDSETYSHPTIPLSEYAHQMWMLQNSWSSHLTTRQKLFECVQLLNFTMRKLSSWAPGVNLSCVLIPSFRIIWLTCCKHLDGLTGTLAKLVFLFPIGKNIMQGSESQRLNRISEALLYKPCVRLSPTQGSGLAYSEYCHPVFKGYITILTFHTPWDQMDYHPTKDVQS